MKTEIFETFWKFYHFEILQFFWKFWNCMKIIIFMKFSGNLHSFLNYGLKSNNRPVSYGILNPMVNWTQGRFTYDILTPGSIFHMLFWPPCPWNINPPTYGISNPLLCIMNSSLLVEMRGGVNLPWGGSKYNDKKLSKGSKYLKENWTRGQNIIGKSTPGSIYHGVQNTIWHRYRK